MGKANPAERAIHAHRKEASAIPIKVISIEQINQSGETSIFAERSVCQSTPLKASHRSKTDMTTRKYGATDLRRVFKAGCPSFCNDKN